MFKYPGSPLIVLLLTLLVSITPWASARQEKKDKKEKIDNQDDKSKPTEAERECQKFKQFSEDLYSKDAALTKCRRRASDGAAGTGSLPFRSSKRFAAQPIPIART
jgi:hypothetical protein